MREIGKGRRTFACAAADGEDPAAADLGRSVLSRVLLRIATDTSHDYALLLARVSPPSVVTARRCSLLFCNCAAFPRAVRNASDRFRRGVRLVDDRFTTRSIHLHRQLAGTWSGPRSTSTERVRTRYAHQLRGLSTSPCHTLRCHHWSVSPSRPRMPTGT